jgi:hypothetical protein
LSPLPFLGKAAAAAEVLTYDTVLRSGVTFR